MSALDEADTLASKDRAASTELPKWRRTFREAVFPWSRVGGSRSLLSMGVFEWFMILALLTNIGALAATDATDNDGTTQKVKIIKWMEVGFTGVYALELLVHGVSYGFDTYKHPMRAVDLAIVVVNGGLLAAFLLGAKTNVSLLGLRCGFRVLRPFFTTTDFPAIRLFIVSVTESVMQLRDVCLLYLLFLLWFGVSAVYQYGGMLMMGCVNDIHGSFGVASLLNDINVTSQPLAMSCAPASNSVSAQYDSQQLVALYRPYVRGFLRKAGMTTLDDYVCGGPFEQEHYADFFEFVHNLSDVNPCLFNESAAEQLLWQFSMGSEEKCSSDQTCDPTPNSLFKGYRCPYGYSCVAFGNPLYGLVGFNNLAQSMLTLFICVTFEYWWQVMFWAADADDYLAYVVFLLVVVLGGFMIINLTVVVLTVEYEKAKNIEGERIKLQMGGTVAKKKGGGFSITAVVRSAMDKTLHAGRKPAAQHTPQGTAATTTATSGALTLVVPSTTHELEIPLITPRAKRSLEGDLHRSLEQDLNGVSSNCLIQLIRIRHFFWDKVVDTQWFFWFNNLIIIANLVSLSYVRFGMSSKEADVIDTLNIAFTVYFTVEAILRFLAESPTQFVQNKFNIFDVAIVVVCWADIAMDSVSIPIVRALRTLRIVKLLKAFPSLYQWIQFIMGAIKGSPMIVLMLLLTMFVFSVFGMQFLGGYFCGLEEDGTAAGLISDSCVGRPRSHFDSFWDAMLTSFILVAGDGWADIMFAGMRARSFLIAFPFLVYFYFGNYILLNLFVAVLMNASNEKGIEEALQEEAKKAAKALEEAKKAVKRIEDGEKADEGGGAKADTAANPEDEVLSSSSGSVQSLESVPEQLQTDFVVLRGGRIQKKTVAGLVIDKYFRQWDKSKKLARKIVEHRAMQGFMGVVIIFSSICMGLEDPFSYPDSTLLNALFYIDVGVTCVYVVELLLNIHAFGILRKETSYLRRDNWNVFDCFLVVISVVGVSVAELRNNTFVRSIKILRALRPLRLVKRSPGMRLVMAGLFGALPQLANVVIISGLILVMWGIAGVQLFSGKLQSCFIGSEELPDLPIANCTSAGGTYINNGLHFDNLGQALISLYVVTTLENWQDLMYRCMDTGEYGEPPRLNYNAYASLYFVFIAALMGLFLSNLFVSVLVDAYNREKRKASVIKSLHLTCEQDAWLLTNKRIARTFPLSAVVQSVRAEGLDAENSMVTNVSFTERMRGRNRALRDQMREVSDGRTFGRLTMVITLLNFVSMAIESYPQDPWITDLVDVLNIIFATLFVLEAAFKIYAESWRGYIASRWNRLDLFVAVVSMACVASASIYNPRASSLIRSLRVLRLGRLTRGYFEIDKMVGKLGRASLSLVHVFALIVLTFFILAVSGMRLFGRAKQNMFPGGVDSHSNFASMGNAMLLHARMMTGGNWPDIMYDCGRKAPFCVDEIGECGLVAPIPEMYFLISTLISMFILRNLIIAVLLDSFSSIRNDRAISKEDARLFYKAWRKFDPKLLLKLKPCDVLCFIRALPPKCVLGFNGLEKRHRIGEEIAFLTSMHLKDPLSFVSVTRVTDALCALAFDCPMPEHGSLHDEIIATSSSMLASFGNPMLRLSSTLLSSGIGALSDFGSTIGRGIARSVRSNDSDATPPEPPPSLISVDSNLSEERRREEEAASREVAATVMIGYVLSKCRARWRAKIAERLKLRKEEEEAALRSSSSSSFELITVGSPESNSSALPQGTERSTFEFLRRSSMVENAGESPAVGKKHRKHVKDKSTPKEQFAIEMKKRFDERRNSKARLKAAEESRNSKRSSRRDQQRCCRIAADNTFLEAQAYALSTQRLLKCVRTAGSDLTSMPLWAVRAIATFAMQITESSYEATNKLAHKHELSSAPLVITTSPSSPLGQQKVTLPHPLELATFWRMKCEAQKAESEMLTINNSVRVWEEKLQNTHVSILDFKRRELTTAKASRLFPEAAIKQWLHSAMPLALRGLEAISPFIASAALPPGADAAQKLAFHTMRVQALRMVSEMWPQHAHSTSIDVGTILAQVDAVVRGAVSRQVALSDATYVAHFVSNLSQKLSALRETVGSGQGEDLSPLRLRDSVLDSCWPASPKFSFDEEDADVTALFRTMANCDVKPRPDDGGDSPHFQDSSASPLRSLRDQMPQSTCLQSDVTVADALAAAESDAVTARVLMQGAVQKTLFCSVQHLAALESIGMETFRSIVSSTVDAVDSLLDVDALEATVPSTLRENQRALAEKQMQLQMSMREASIATDLYEEERLRGVPPDALDLPEFVFAEALTDLQLRSRIAILTHLCSASNALAQHCIETLLRAEKSEVLLDNTNMALANAVEDTLECQEDLRDQIAYFKLECSELELEHPPVKIQTSATELPSVVVSGETELPAAEATQRPPASSQVPVVTFQPVASAAESLVHPGTPATSPIAPASPSPLKARRRLGFEL